MSLNARLLPTFNFSGFVVLLIIFVVTIVEGVDAQFFECSFLPPSHKHEEDVQKKEEISPLDFGMAHLKVHLISCSSGLKH
jgi:hypothetical protein